MREATLARGGGAWDAALERGDSGGAQKSVSCAQPDGGEIADLFSLRFVSPRHGHGNFRSERQGLSRIETEQHQ